MIPLSDRTWQSRSWQWLLANAVTSRTQLLEELALDLPGEDTDFPVLVPRPWLARIERGNPHDPLLRQVLPYQEETIAYAQSLTDPLQESGFSPIGGLLQKYQGRALIIPTGQCGIHCRYCFRRHFPYRDFQPDSAQWNKLISHVKQQKDLSEIILSGGDPLALNDTQLSRIITALATISHLRVIRIHTRMPIAIPQRVTASLLEVLHQSPIKITMVLHVNHAREVDVDTAESIQALANSGVTLLNQSVLLKGVNDSLEALADLSWRLFDVEVLPYYLHLMDKVSGGMHYQVQEGQGTALIEEMRASLPGYLVPKLVKEEPGRPSKTLIR